MRKIKSFVKENTVLNRKIYPFDFGWGNGYVGIPKGHELHGKSYDEIYKLIPTLKVNGGLTFSNHVGNIKWVEIPKYTRKNGWVIGFDTLHCWDTLEKWSKEAVMAEAKNLKKQLMDYENR